MNKVWNKENFGFAGLQWLYWSASCTVIPFLVIYLKAKDYSEVQTGAVMAAISLTSIFAQPFWGNYCDRKNTMRNILVGCLLVSGVITFLIPVFYRSFTVIIVIGLVISFTESSMSSIIDSWTVKTAVQKPWVDYGLTRGMGSLGYSVTALIFGALLDRYGYGLMFSTHMGIIVLFIVCCFYVGKINKSVFTKNTCIPKSTDIPPVSKTPRFTLKGSRPFVWFLVASTLAFIGFRANSTFYAILLRQLGGNNSQLGISLFVLAASEVPIFFLSKRLLQKYKDTAIILVSLFFMAVKILCGIVVTSIPALIAVQATQALSFGLFLPASVYYIGRISPPGLGSTYMTVAVSCYYGLGGIIGSFAGGWIIDSLGIYPMLWIGVSLSLLGMFVFFFSTCMPRNTPPSDRPTDWRTRRLIRRLRRQRLQSFDRSMDFTTDL